MDQLAYSRMLVRSLKGAALSIWTIMLLNPAKVVWEVEDLITATDYKKDTILQGRKVLIAHGLAANIGARYGLRLTTSGARQLPLPTSLDLIQGHQQGEELPDTSDEVEKIDFEVEKIDLAPVVVVVDQDLDLALANQQQQHPAKSKKSTSLTAAGIHGRKRYLLLKDDWVTSDRVNGWREKVGDMASSGYRFRDETGVGFLITQLENHIEPPEDTEVSAQRERMAMWQKCATKLHLSDDDAQSEIADL